MPSIPLTDRPSWKALREHHAKIKDIHLRELFGEDAKRGERLTVEAVGLYLDYSKHRVTDDTLRLLLRLADEVDLRSRIAGMFRGDRINATENRSVVAAAVAFWIGIFSIAALAFNRRRGLIALSILSLSIFALAMLASYELDRGKNGRGLAIVTGENVEARLATADNANRVLTLPAGSEIKVVSQRGDWIYAALPNNLRGWMPANSAEQVRM